MAHEQASTGSFQRAERPEKLGAFTYPVYPFVTPPELATGQPGRSPVVVVGGGMVGLTVAIDIARKGVRCVLIDDNDTVSAGSRSIAQARRTMDIWSRLGCAAEMAAKGVSWSKGHTHHEDRCVLSFEVFPEGGTRYPSFTSLAQYYVEHFLVERARAFDNLELRWRNRLADMRETPDGVELEIETPEGSYQLRADWVVAADGARSAARKALGLAFPGSRVKDKFVIADVRIRADLPNERNYWFSPPFYDGNTVLRVPQSDSIWRIDWQIDPDTDVARELSPANVHERLERIFGDGTDFVAEWVSTYASEHRLMDTFRHGRVLFAGDAAHQFSPFGGGRGGNSGIQDADNLAWKLCAVIEGRASESLLDSYSAERRRIALRNLSDSMKSTEFITPKSPHSKGLRDAVLRLAAEVPFAKAYVNTGRFAVWPVLETSPLSVPDEDAFAATGRPGTPALDCQLTNQNGQTAWLTDQLGDAFVLVVYGEAGIDRAWLEKTSRDLFPLHAVEIMPQAGSGGLVDAEGAFRRLYDASLGAAWLFRPDQHVLARWRRFDADKVASAMRKALGREKGTER